MHEYTPSGATWHPQVQMVDDTDAPTASNLNAAVTDNAERTQFLYNNSTNPNHLLLSTTYTFTLGASATITAVGCGGGGGGGSGAVGGPDFGTHEAMPGGGGGGQAEIMTGVFQLSAGSYTATIGTGGNSDEDGNDTTIAYSGGGDVLARWRGGKRGQSSEALTVVTGANTKYVPGGGPGYADYYQAPTPIVAENGVVPLLPHSPGCGGAGTASGTVAVNAFSGLPSNNVQALGSITTGQGGAQGTFSGIIPGGGGGGGGGGWGGGHGGAGGNANGSGIGGAGANGGNGGYAKGSGGGGGGSGGWGTTGGAAPGSGGVGGSGFLNLSWVEIGAHP